MPRNVSDLAASVLRRLSRLPRAAFVLMCSVHSQRTKAPPVLTGKIDDDHLAGAEADISFIDNDWDGLS